MDDDDSAVSVSAVARADVGWPRESLIRVWGTTWVARRGELLDAGALPALVASICARPVGLATYSVVGDEWELVSIHAEERRTGVGGALLRAVEALAVAAGAVRIWLVTTNDNTSALRFYQRAGYNLVALHRDAVTRARTTLKPEIPMEMDGIEMRHELELERQLR